MTFGIRGKLLGFTLSLVLLTGGGISLYSISQARSRIFATFEREALHVTELIAETVLDELYFLDVHGIRHRLESARVNPDIRYAYVTDRQGVVLADGTVENPLRGRPLPEEYREQTLQAAGWASRTHGRTLTISGPLLTPDGSRLGHLVVAYSLDRPDAVARESSTASVLITMICLAIGGALAFVFATNASRAVFSIVRAAVEIGQGNLGIRLPITRRDELGTLAQALNGMAQSLEHGREELERANLRLETTVQERTAGLSALHSVSVAVSKSLDLAETLGVVADAILPALRAEGCLIRTVTPQTGELVARAARGLTDASLAGRRVLRDDPFHRLLLGLREPLIIADLAEDPRGAAIGIGVEGYRSYAAVPLWAKEQLLGSLSVFAREPGRFGPPQRHLLASIAAELATAMARAELFHQVLADAEFRKASAELALTLSSTLKVEEVLSLTCSETARLFQVGGSYLWQVDGERGELVGAAAHGHKAQVFLGLRFPLAAPDSASAAAAREGRSQVIHDIPASPIANGFLPKTFDGGSVLTVPLRVRDKVTGVLVLNDLHPSRRFSPADVQGAEVLAGQAALAIENARLYSQVLAHAEVLEQRVIERTRELEEVSRHKSEFLAHMSHELRTPLNAIIGFAQLLEQGVGGALEPKQQHYVGNIHRSGKYLLTLINDILDLAKVEAGRLELHLEDLSVPQLVDETMAIVKGMAASRGVKLEVAVGEEVTRITADPVRLKQMLFNLLSNAVKFTPPGGGVTLRASGASEREQVLFAVADTGIGIKPEDLKRLFRPFEQVHSGEARKLGGTGLGLSLTKQLVELHGGRIWAESPGPGRGTTFTIALPRQQAAPRMSILVVDDTAFHRELVADTLRAAGFAVEQAADGIEALDQISRNRPDLLVLDLTMPRMSGRELLRRLRDQPATSTIPAILISGAEGVAEEEMLSLGVSAFLSKPFSPAVLLHTITGILTAPPSR